MNKIVRVDSFNGMLLKRTFNIVYVNQQNAIPFSTKNEQGKIILYTGKKISLKINSK